MSENIKPVIVISKCLGFEACRYDGEIVKFPFKEKLAQCVDLITVCPEMEIGLGVPRLKIELIKINNTIQVIQKNTDKNLTEPLYDFSLNFLENSLNQVDGFILKSKSPSCGMGDCKFYAENNKELLGREDGIFYKAVKEKYPGLPRINVKKLQNQKKKIEFLQKVYTGARFRKIKKKRNINSLIAFHSKNKFLLQLLDEQLMRKMGTLAANPDHLSVSEILHNYEEQLIKAFKKTPASGHHINVLEHCYGFLSGKISSEEKESYKIKLSKYQKGEITIINMKNYLWSLIKKYNIEYLKKQTYFKPFPPSLIDKK